MIRWLGVGVLCAMLSVAQATIQEDLEAGLSPLEAVQNALEEGIPAEEIALLLLDAGYDPTSTAELVVNAAPQNAALICTRIVQTAKTEEKLVGEIAAACTRAAPADAAAEIAAAVSEVAPENAAEIAAAVSEVAPENAAEIAAAVTQVMPENAAEIAAAVTQVAPDAAAEIVAAVSKVAPDTVEDIDEATETVLAPPSTPSTIIAAIQQETPAIEGEVDGHSNIAGLIDTGEKTPDGQTIFIVTDPIRGEITDDRVIENDADDESLIIVDDNNNTTDERIDIIGNLPEVVPSPS
ncbi:MAG: hypothetical protein ABFS56_09045 [Pseudomonadota bacterium]